MATPPDQQQQSLLFTQLPLDIRRQIYIQYWQIYGSTQHIFLFGPNSYLSHFPCVLDKEEFNHYCQPNDDDDDDDDDDEHQEDDDGDGDEPESHDDPGDVNAAYQDILDNPPETAAGPAHNDDDSTQPAQADQSDQSTQPTHDDQPESHDDPGDINAAIDEIVDNPPQTAAGLAQNDGNTQPAQPAQPAQPTQPAQPAQPALPTAAQIAQILQPNQVAHFVQPAQAGQPAQILQVIHPAQPAPPVQPGQPPQPVHVFQFIQPTQHGPPVPAQTTDTTHADDLDTWTGSPWCMHEGCFRAYISAYNMEYERAFSRNYKGVRTHSGQRRHMPPPSTVGMTLPFHVCKRMYIEASESLFSNVRFRFDDIFTLERFAKHLSLEAADRVRSVEMLLTVPKNAEESGANARNYNHRLCPLPNFCSALQDVLPNITNLSLTIHPHEGWAAHTGTGLPRLPGKDWFEPLYKLTASLEKLRKLEVKLVAKFCIPEDEEPEPVYGATPKQLADAPFETTLVSTGWHHDSVCRSFLVRGSDLDLD